MKFMTNEEGVSPVIGVILMVAITVILAAVISVFVFGLAGDLESSSQKDLTIKTGTNDDGDITFTIFAGDSVGSLMDINWTNGTQSGNISGNFSIGYMNTTQWNKGASGTVTFTATFLDGTRQVVATAP